MTEEKETPTFADFYWNGAKNKFVILIPLLIGILALCSIKSYPDYKAESIAAFAFTMLIQVINLVKSIASWQKATQSKS